MRRKPVSVACALALCMAATGAPAQGVDSLNIIRTPLSPAFALMGIAPVAIERPSTPRAFAVSLVSAGQGIARLPESWAVEIAPFWLRPRPLFRYQDFYDGHAGKSFVRTLSISVATSRRDTATAATDVGIGLRAQPVPGRESSISVAIRDSIRQVQLRTVRASSARRAAERAAVAATTDSARQAQQEIADSLSGLIDALADSARSYAQKLNQNQERVGFSLDLAGAWNFGFPTDAFTGGRTAGVGLWTTLGYRLENPQFQLLALGRFIRDVRAEDQNLVDLGSRLVWALERLAISVEGVRRIAPHVALDGTGEEAGTGGFESSGRLVGTVEYRLNPDRFFYASFGQDHKPRGSERLPLLVTAGLSLEFGSRPSLLR